MHRPAVRVLLPDVEAHHANPSIVVAEGTGEPNPVHSQHSIVQQNHVSLYKVGYSSRSNIVHEDEVHIHQKNE